LKLRKFLDASNSQYAEKDRPFEQISGGNKSGDGKNQIWPIGGVKKKAVLLESKIDCRQSVQQFIIKAGLDKGNSSSIQFQAFEYENQHFIPSFEYEVAQFGRIFSRSAF